MAVAHWMGSSTGGGVHGSTLGQGWQAKLPTGMLTNFHRKPSTGVLLKLTEMSSTLLTTVHGRNKQENILEPEREIPSSCNVLPVTSTDESLTLVAVGEIFTGSRTSITTQSQEGWIES